jgi:hypothetical protein
MTGPWAAELLADFRSDQLRGNGGAAADGDPPARDRSGYGSCLMRLVNSAIWLNSVRRSDMS